MIQFDEHIFEMGWNHQLAIICIWLGVVINLIVGVLYTHYKIYKDSLLKVGWVYTQFKEFRPWHIWG